MIYNTDQFLDLQKSILTKLQKIEKNPEVFWQCSGAPVYSKFQAMRNLSAGMPTKFYFYDKPWSLANWTSSSTPSFEELLINRAIELRKKYQYVRLAYSGGADSHTALMAFKLAGLAPDEIYFWSMLGEHKSVFDTNFEINRAVVPYIDTIKEWFPSTKIRHLNLDYTKYRALKLLDPSHPAFEISTGLRSFTTSFSLATDNFEIGPNVITITGSDKPRLDFINGNWYAWLTDVGCMHAWGENVTGFFQSADPTLYIKQCHSLKDYLLTQLPRNEPINRKQILKMQTADSIKERQNLNAAIGRFQPFNSVSMSRKRTSRPGPGQGENGIKAYCLWRTIRGLPDGKDFLKRWENIKVQFEHSTGYNPSIELFGKFYNLNTGEICTVDDLFPNGWNLND